MGLRAGLADALRESGLVESTSDVLNAGILVAGAMILVHGLTARWHRCQSASHRGAVRLLASLASPGDRPGKDLAPIPTGYSP